MIRIGKRDNDFVSMATADDDTITIRRATPCFDVIGEVGFRDYFYFLVTGTLQAPPLGIRISSRMRIWSWTTVRLPFSFGGEPEPEVTASPLLDEHGSAIRPRVG